MTLTGTGFVTGSTVAISGSGVAISDVAVVSATSITARLAVDAAADIGARSLTVTTAGGTTAAQTVTINPTTPAINSASPSSAQPGQTVDITFRGTGFVQGATTVTVSGTGVTVLGTTISSAGVQSGPQDQSGTMVAGNSTTIVVRLAIDANAAPGARTVTVTTAGGSSVGFTFTISAPFPVIERFTANPVIIQRGGSSTLTWSGVSNATTCSINVNIGTVPCANGSIVVTPTATTEYMFTAVGSGGREWTYATVVVEEPAVAAPPVVVVTPGSQTFTTAGSTTFTVPAGVTQVQVTAIGAKGGNGQGNANGALGGRVVTTVSVTPGETLTVLVGGVGGNGVAASLGAGGSNGGGSGGAGFIGLGVGGGGGGGGATELRRGGTQLVVAGGGGGSAGQVPGGGGGTGGQSGSNGTAGSVSGSAGGQGATPSAAGLGTAGQGSGTAGSDGAAGVGGNGGNGAGSAGGGGGGGVFGGGGAGGSQNFASGGGGGGSSMGAAGAVFTSGVDATNGGNGRIVISWP